MKAELLDSMGNDLAVVNAARVSFDKESMWKQTEWEEPDERRKSSCSRYQAPDGSTKQYEVMDNDRGLIRYLARHGHFTPFTHVVVKLRETVPVFVARQRFKHTVGFSYNETSRRYVSDLPEFFTPNEWRGRPVNVKQGSSGTFDEYTQGWLTKDYKLLMQTCEDFYNHFIAAGVAPEQARMVLPQSMYTSYIVTGSLAAWARAYKLRTDEHAQQEIQELARSWANLIRPIAPVSWDALCGDAGGDSKDS